MPEQKTETPLIRALVADDHPIVVEGICSLLQRLPEVEIVARAASGAEVLRAVREPEPPDIVVMDLSMPSPNGIETTKELTRAFPELKVILLTVYSGPSIVRAAFEAGARGYVLKEGVTDCLIEAVHEVTRGGLYVCPMLRPSSAVTGVGESDAASSFLDDDPLTRREREVLQLIADGLTSRRIAEELCISAKTVGTHREHIMAKLRIHTIAGLTRYVIERELAGSEIYETEADLRRRYRHARREAVDQPDSAQAGPEA